MSRPWVTVVGMVADERHNGVTGVVKEKFYMPHSQWHIATSGSVIRGGFLVIRTTGDPMQVAGPGAERDSRDGCQSSGREHPSND